MVLLNEFINKVGEIGWIVYLALPLVQAFVQVLFARKYARSYFRKKSLHRQRVDRLQLEFKEQLLKAQLEIQEQTFEAISQEIHDNVGQMLSLAKVQISIISASEPMDLTLLEDIRANIGKAITDLRDLSKSLSSERIRSCSLERTLYEEAVRINKTGVIRMEVSAEGKVREIEPQKKLILFRVIQESIQNCIRHAEARKIGIWFRYGPEAIHVSIRDNGKGFDVDAGFRDRSGQGLANMRTRARLIGGACTIVSGLNEGTTINLMIPYH